MDQPSKPSPLSFNWGILLIAIAVLWAGCSLDLSQHSRFHSDNAMGATANAAEAIRDHTYIVRPGELLLAGVLFLVFGRLGQIRDAIVETRKMPVAEPPIGQPLPPPPPPRSR